MKPSQTKIDVLTSLAVEHPTWSPKKLKEVFEKRGKQTVSMPVVYEARKRAQELLKPVTEEEFAAALDELRDEGVEVHKAPGITESADRVGRPHTQTKEMEVEGKPDGNGNINVSIVGLGGAAGAGVWHSMSIPVEDIEATAEACKKVEEKLAQRDNCTTLMTALALTGFLGKDKIGQVLDLVEELGLERMRALINLIGAS